MKINNVIKIRTQAGAELGQAQQLLGLKHDIDRLE